MNSVSRPVRKAVQKVGYVRVSSASQNPGRQLAEEELDVVFTDMASGKNAERPQLKLCLQYVCQGDQLHVHSLDRLGRSVKDLLQIVENLTQTGVSVHFHKERIIFSPGESDPMSNLILHVFGAIAQFERALIRERQREGIERAKARGVYKGRRKAINIETATEIREAVARGEQKTAQARKYGVSRKVIYRVLNHEHPYED